MKTRRRGRGEGAEEEEKKGAGGREQEESRTRGHRSYERGVKDERAGGRGEGEGKECGGPLRRRDAEEEKREGGGAERRREGTASTVTVSEREVTSDPFVRPRLRPASFGQSLSVPPAGLKQLRGALREGPAWAKLTRGGVRGGQGEREERIRRGRGAVRGEG